MYPRWRYGATPSGQVSEDGIQPPGEGVYGSGEHTGTDSWEGGGEHVSWGQADWRGASTVPQLEGVARNIKNKYDNRSLECSQRSKAYGGRGQMFNVIKGS